ncbi:MAG: amidase family protein, partial [Pseudomonadota bacterium]
VPGGSSSGAAASVAFATAVAGIGSDTGGSVRIPAAWNDLVGLKTTSELISLEGVVPLCETFDTVGPLCRGTQDAAHLLTALGGPETDLAGASLVGRRLAVCQTVALDDIEDAPGRAFEAAVSKLSAAGAQVTDVHLPMVADMFPLSACLVTTEAYARWGEAIEANPDALFPEILGRFRAGRDFSGVEYLRAWAKLRDYRRQYAAATAGFDAVLAPTAPILPPNKARLESDSDYYQRANLLALRNTRIGNLMGLCALTLPTGTPSCGLMVLAPPFTESRLLRLGRALEIALGV